MLRMFGRVRRVMVCLVVLRPVVSMTLRTVLLMGARTYAVHGMAVPGRILACQGLTGDGIVMPAIDDYNAAVFVHFAFGLKSADYILNPLVIHGKWIHTGGTND